MYKEDKNNVQFNVNIMGLKKVSHMFKNLILCLRTLYQDFWVLRTGPLRTAYGLKPP